MGIFKKSDEERVLEGRSVAILATNGFEQSELMEPKAALEQAGADVKIVSPKLGMINGWRHGDWAESIEVDVSLEEADAATFDALMLPGGVINSDKLRMNERAVEFVRNFVQAGKPIAAICHAPWILIEADAVQGRTVTSWASLRTDLNNAGAYWLDQEVVVDNGLVTSRKPDDLPAFNQKMIEEYREGLHDPSKRKQVNMPREMHPH